MGYHDNDVLRGLKLWSDFLKEGTVLDMLHGIFLVLSHVKRSKRSNEADPASPGWLSSGPWMFIFMTTTCCVLCTFHCHEREC